MNVRADSAHSRTVAAAGGRADRAAGVDPAHAAPAVGLLLRPWSAVARSRQVHLPGLPGVARRGRGLVHAALHLYVAVPVGPRAFHPDDDADLVGRRAGGL